MIFFFNDTATTEIYTLSLHDALPISRNTVVQPEDFPSSPCPAEIFRVGEKAKVDMNGRELGDSNGRNADGRVMAVQALQNSQLVGSDGSTLLSRDPAADIRTDSIGRHRRYELSMLDRMVEFATMSTCRLEVVLRYFGETGDEACGRCDNCRAPESGRNGRAGKGSGRSRSGTRAVPPEDMTPGDPDKRLFETLRAWRTQQAKTQSVPAYVIFSNRVLIELARSKPTDTLRLMNVSGVGAVKRDKYGQKVLRLIIDHVAANR